MPEPLNSASGPRGLRAIVLGADALLTAAPASPVQVAHAAQAVGFDIVAPATWGDELVAAECARRVSMHDGPMLQCSCPRVAARLNGAALDLGVAIARTIAPPAAAARYLRAIHAPAQLHITFAGSCEGAIDPLIDARVMPNELLALFETRGISLENQPRVFDSVIPPDRRRFYSLPGGAPSERALEGATPGACVEIGGDDVIAEVAQILLSGDRVLVDAAVGVGCACAGASPGVNDQRARERIVALEPPRSNGPVVDLRLGGDLGADASMPTQALVAPEPPPVRHPTPARASGPISLSRTPSRPVAAIESRPRNSPSPSRQIGGSSPQVRDAEGRQLPRTYIARRRTSPRGIQSGEIRRLSGDLDTPSESFAPIPSSAAAVAIETATKTEKSPTADGGPGAAIGNRPPGIVAPGENTAVDGLLLRVAARPIATLAIVCGSIFASVLAAILVARAILR